jgi:hypothetical protein
MSLEATAGGEHRVAAGSGADGLDQLFLGGDGVRAGAARLARRAVVGATCYAQIGGLAIATAITLILVPVFYSISVLDLKIVRWEAGRH